jgi:hypothetical protein
MPLRFEGVGFGELGDDLEPDASGEDVAIIELDGPHSSGIIYLLKYAFRNTKVVVK